MLKRLPIDVEYRVPACLLSNFVEFWSEFSEKKSNIHVSQSIRGQGSYLVFPIWPKTTYLVEDIEILLPVKFCWIPFTGFREKVENVSANQRLGRLFWFSDWPEKHKLHRGLWNLLPVKFLWIPFSGFREEVENISAIQRPGRSSWFNFSDLP